MSIRKPIVVRGDGSFEVLPDTDALAISISSAKGNLATQDDEGLLVTNATLFEYQVTQNISSIPITQEQTITVDLPQEFKVTEGRRVLVSIEYAPTTVPPAGNGLIATVVFPRDAGGVYDSKVIYCPIPAKRAKLTVGSVVGETWGNLSVTISGATSTPIIASNVTVTVSMLPDVKRIN